MKGYDKKAVYQFKVDDTCLTIYEVLNNGNTLWIQQEMYNGDYASDVVKKVNGQWCWVWGVSVFGEVVGNAILQYLTDNPFEEF